MQKQDFSGKTYFFISESEFFDFSEFHGCKIWRLFNFDGRKFQAKSKHHGRNIWRLIFFGNYVEEAWEKKTLALGPKKYFSTFFLAPPSRGPIFGPILDPF